MASMQGVQPRVGYADLLCMPEDGRRYEIHGGELVVVPSPLPRHQIAALATFTLLREHTAAAGGIEVLSPSTASTDRGRKMRTFARYGVPEYWIVDPLARQVEVHALADGAYRTTRVAAGGETVRSALLPDLTFEAARLFELPW